VYRAFQIICDVTCQTCPLFVKTCQTCIHANSKFCQICQNLHTTVFNIFQKHLQNLHSLNSQVKSCCLPFILAYKSRNFWQNVNSKIAIQLIHELVKNNTNFTYKWVFNFGQNIAFKMTIQLVRGSNYTRVYMVVYFPFFRMTILTGDCVQ
jgi:hypothetical protein